MNRQEFEQMLISDLVDGNSYDVTKYIKPKDMEEELAELMSTWAAFETDPIKLQGALKRHLVGLVNRIVKEQDLPEYEMTDEDWAMARGDYERSERRDRSC